MKAVFKGYLYNFKPSHVGIYFTVGKIYDLIPHEYAEGFYNVKDDNGFAHSIRPNKLVYDFEFILSYDELFDGCCVSEISNKPQCNEKRFTYYINGVSVTKERFDSALSCVKDFEAEGVDASSIKFELKFE